MWHGLESYPMLPSPTPHPRVPQKYLWRTMYPQKCLLSSPPLRNCYFHSLRVKGLQSHSEAGWKQNMWHGLESYPMISPRVPQEYLWRTSIPNSASPQETVTFNSPYIKGLQSDPEAGAEKNSVAWFNVISYFFFFCVPTYISGVHHFWWAFCIYDSTVFFFLNPIKKVVTFHLCGWFMLGVFLLPAFTHLGREYQDLLSSCNACVHRLNFGLYSRPKEFSENGSQNYFKFKEKIPSTGGSEKGQTPNTASCKTASPDATNWVIPSPCHIQRFPLKCPSHIFHGQVSPKVPPNKMSSFPLRKSLQS